MLKEITREEALSVIKEYLYQEFCDKIKSLSVVKDKVKRDYDNFLDFQKYENYTEDEAKELNDLMSILVSCNSSPISITHDSDLADIESTIIDIDELPI